MPAGSGGRRAGTSLLPSCLCKESRTSHPAIAGVNTTSHLPTLKSEQTQGVFWPSLCCGHIACGAALMIIMILTWGSFLSDQALNSLLLGELIITEEEIKAQQMNSFQLVALFRQGGQFMAIISIGPALSNSPQLQPELP